MFPTFVLPLALPPTEAIPNTVSVTIVHQGTQDDVSVDRDIDADVGDTITIHFRAIQTEQATYVVHGLPGTAHAVPAEDGIDIHWTPVEDDAGTYDVLLQVTDSGREAERHLRIAVEHTHHAFFVPGVITSIFIPNNATRLGAFWGGGVEVLLYAFAQRGHVWFPSHGRFYFDFEVAGSTQPNVDALVQGALGFDLTIEQTPRRRVLLPFIGMETGITFQKQTGTFGWAMPLGGLYFYASPRMRFGLKGGYLLPTTGDQDTRGVRLALTLDYGWW